MNIRLYNAKILTMADGAQLINGEVWAENGIITNVGSAESRKVKWDREIDCCKNLLMPGFKNAHTHSAMTFLRSYADDLPLLDWLEKQVFPMEAKLKPEHIKPLAKLAFMEYLTSGITACFDMYMFPAELVQASISSGFRTVLCGCFSNFINTIENLEAQHVSFNKINPLISHQLGFHAEYTTDRDKLLLLAQLSQKYKAPVYTHCSESLREHEQCVEKTGKTPVQHIADCGLFEHGGGLYHGVHLTNNDIALCAKKNVAVISNPGSNTKLASGIAPLSQMQGAGVALALGTDGAASNNSLDFFKEMFLACGLAKLKEDNAAAMPAFDVLKMATVGGAKVMGLNNCDTLQKGKCADLIMINLNRPNMQPQNNTLNNLVYSGSKENVKMTMINGKILYEDGEFFIGESAESVYKKANEIIREMA